MNGTDVVGALVGALVGTLDGTELVWAKLGNEVNPEPVGALDGTGLVGSLVGALDGAEAVRLAERLGGRVGSDRAREGSGLGGQGGGGPGESGWSGWVW